MSGQILTPGEVGINWSHTETPMATPTSVSGQTPAGLVAVAFGGMRTRLAIAKDLLAAEVAACGLEVVASEDQIERTSPTETVVAALQLADLLIDAERKTWEQLQTQAAAQHNGILTP